uniref:Uncharacterized protein n=1 Tax=Pithovirus LCDPAC02 TaxID=2506601 RepID=A0A481YNG4_9VIRU|nr:MAG: hypothetical protein LCDPAC02_00270 [Pithovirus LCDPAC02]
MSKQKITISESDILNNFKVECDTDKVECDTDKVEVTNIKLDITYYGDVTCSSILSSGKRKGEKCGNKAKYEILTNNETFYFCGNHCRKLEKKELPVRKTTRIYVRKTNTTLVTIPEIKPKKLTKKQIENLNYAKDFYNNLLKLSNVVFNKLSEINEEYKGKTLFSMEFVSNKNGDKILFVWKNNGYNYRITLLQNGDYNLIFTDITNFSSSFKYTNFENNLKLNEEDNNNVNYLFNNLKFKRFKVIFNETYLIQYKNNKKTPGDIKYLLSQFESL